MVSLIFMMVMGGCAPIQTTMASLKGSANTATTPQAADAIVWPIPNSDGTVQARIEPSQGLLYTITASNGATALVRSFAPPKVLNHAWSVGAPMMALELNAPECARNVFVYRLEGHTWKPYNLSNCNRSVHVEATPTSYSVTEDVVLNNNNWVWRYDSIGVHRDSTFASPSEWAARRARERDEQATKVHQQTEAHYKRADAQRLSAPAAVHDSVSKVNTARYESQATSIDLDSNTK